MKHKHADLMALYAQDAMETDKPWERWECHDGDGRWKQAVWSPRWCAELSYRRKPTTTMKHKHADLMLQYAKDAMETDKPWERWECRHGDGPWKQAVRSPQWQEEFSYRRKPKTININGFEVPEPLRSFGKLNRVYRLRFRGSLYAEEVFKHSVETWPFEVSQDLFRGVLHATKEAAELHAKALLSFTQTDQQP